MITLRCFKILLTPYDSLSVLTSTFRFPTLLNKLCSSSKYLKPDHSNDMCCATCKIPPVDPSQFLSLVQFELA